MGGSSEELRQKVRCCSEALGAGELGAGSWELERMPWLTQTWCRSLRIFFWAGSHPPSPSPRKKGRVCQITPKPIPSRQHYIFGAGPPPTSQPFPLFPPFLHFLGLHPPNPERLFFFLPTAPSSKLHHNNHKFSVIARQTTSVPAPSTCLTGKKNSLTAKHHHNASSLQESRC